MLACVPSPVKDASEQNADLLTCVGEKSSLDEVLAFALSKINLEDGGNISGDCVQVLLKYLISIFPPNQEKLEHVYFYTRVPEYFIAVYLEIKN